MYRERYKYTIIMDKQKSIQALQAYATGLATQSRAHKVQSQLFASQGFSKHAEKYALDEEEDMFWMQEQLELIEKIGLQNWLVKQL